MQRQQKHRWGLPAQALGPTADRSRQERPSGRQLSHPCNRREGDNTGSDNIRPPAATLQPASVKKPAGSNWGRLGVSSSLLRSKWSSRPTRLARWLGLRFLFRPQGLDRINCHRAARRYVARQHRSRDEDERHCGERNRISGLMPNSSDRINRVKAVARIPQRRMSALQIDPLDRLDECALGFSSCTSKERTHERLKTSPPPWCRARSTCSS